MSDSNAEMNLFDICVDLFNESDRGVVLVFQTMLDEKAIRLLESKFRSTGTPSGEIKWLLTQRPQPPLQSFAVKCRVLRAFGLIDASTRNAALKLNSLRIDAAHAWHSFALSDEDVDPILDCFQQDVAEEIRKQVTSDLTFFMSLPSDVQRLALNRNRPERLTFEYCAWSIWSTLHSKAEELAGHAPTEVTPRELAQLMSRWLTKFTIDYSHS